MRSLRPTPVALAFALLLAAAGCGRSLPPVATVSGRVMLAGKPVTTGAVWFYPAGSGRPAIGQIGPDGRFTLATFAAGDGALLGDHRVVIEAREIERTSAPPPKAAADLPADLPEEVRREMESGMLLREKVIWLVPEVYAATSTTPLRADVKPGSNTIDFDLPAP
ncbi:MAG: hypothetical protein ACKOEM_17075 [Planctomycetia bacterium]